MDPFTLTIGGAMVVVTAVAATAGSYAVTKYRSERAEIAAAEAKLLALQAINDLNAFRLEAARRFVTDEMLVKVEERVVEAINRLGDRLDRLLDDRLRRANGGQGR
ncbi:MAG: hypothetical protein FD152_1274 [Xanthobacteraceae bacterium]|nr:MAG: hypothetical protein FD152_1274 [Xanthobacteraceae bacterium]